MITEPLYHVYWDQDSLSGSHRMVVTTTPLTPSTTTANHISNLYWGTLTRKALSFSFKSFNRENPRNPIKVITNLKGEVVFTRQQLEE